MSFLVTVVIFPFLQWSSNSNEQVIQFNDFNKIDLYESNFFVICLCQYQIILQMLYKDTPLCVQPPLYQQIVSSVLWKRHFAFPVKEFSEVTCNYCLLIFWNLIIMLRIIYVRCQETIFTTDL